MHKHSPVRQTEKKAERGFQEADISPVKREVLAVPIFDALHADPQRPMINDISVEISAGEGGEIIIQERGGATSAGG